MQAIVLVEHVSTILIDGHQQLSTIVVRQTVSIGLALQELGRAVVYQMLVVGARGTSGLLLRTSAGASPKEGTEKKDKLKTKPTHHNPYIS